MLEWLSEELEERRGLGLFRTKTLTNHRSATEIDVDGQRLVNFGGNDYLGLATHPRLLAAVDETRAHGTPNIETRWGSGASPLVSGYGPAHACLENDLAEFEQTEAAIVFSTGYAANVGTVAALTKKQDVIFSDELNHASLIDGCRLSRASVYVYPHADMNQLQNLIRQHRASAKRAFIVTDSIFSMTGDLAPLNSIVEIAEKFGLVTIVDEAHATGVYGQFGRGLCEYFDLMNRVPVRIGTLSKAIGSLGGFVVGSQVLIDYLRNFARTYVYSTAMPAALARVAREGLKLAHQMNDERVLLQQQSKDLRHELRKNGWSVSAGDSPIVPVSIGNPETTTQLSLQLRKEGHFVPAIRPPTVPLNRSLLRISLSVKHTEKQLHQLVRSFQGIAK